MKKVGEFIINGVTYAVVQEVQEDDKDVTEYATDGFSVEQRHGCVRSKALDEFLDVMLISDDEDEREVALSFPRWFCIWLPTRTYTEREKEIQQCNFWKAMRMWGPMVLYSFYPDATKEGIVDPRKPRDWMFGETLEGFSTPGYRPDYKLTHMEFPTAIFKRFKGQVSTRKSTYRPAGSP